MAFGISRKELNQWKEAVEREEISFLTHFWLDKRFPQFHTVTKVGCSNLERLTLWCVTHGLNPKYIHNRQPFPHFDLMGPKQQEILHKEGMWEQLKRFRIEAPSIE
ncbi:hypothetical protein EHS13_17130 [Paenibacillus psychroresistens]|uniref:Uncharacterized protein n=1 Tax=Paenibacillus psychroresistens TaxID=1778678 RepID=A0A6B8RLT0_9BACL|nr:hypothetical protein [Paenibacillus psychroresistens]QGQ96485.1 hypothetical protein EHS13_17130 [Paenibacillus psychroresistens]